MKILYAARLVNFKDPLTFIEAANKMPQHIFILAGDGPLMQKCKQKAGNNTKILGWIPQTKVNQLMKNSDIFCQLSPTENIWSASLIAAMKNKMPIICTNAGYTQKYLKNRVHCLLVQPRNPNDIAKAIELLTKNQTLKEKLGENAYDYVQENLKTTKITKEIHNLLIAIL